MNYAKPEITLHASANSVIQGGTGKSIVNMPDNAEPLTTPAAYEADE
jgi:hypothetical protein